MVYIVAGEYLVQLSAPVLASEFVTGLLKLMEPFVCV